MKKDLDEIRKEIALKDQEINLKEAQTHKLGNLARDQMLRENISSR